MVKPTRLDYCQYLLSSPINYTLTHFADHSEDFSHDMINRYLAGDCIPPRLVWENVKPHLVQVEEGYVIFDDTVLDKKHARHIELVRRQYSGNARGVINGIGVVTCVYVNPLLDRFWVIDYRIYDPEGDGKTKLDHVRDMLSLLVYQRQLLFQAVLMDSWYATKTVMLHIENLGKVYYCPLKTNRLVDDSNATKPYQRIDNLAWTPTELHEGKRIKIKGFPRDHKVKLFRVASDTGRTDYVVTNDLAQNDTSVTQQACNWRWKIEQFHREAKQLTGLEKCQCRLARIVRNHIGCALLVWIRLATMAYQTGRTIYQVKHGMLQAYLRQQLKSPAINMVLA
jgi:SRSO17 transposase